MTPRVDSQFPIILTAWTKRLRLKGYDAAKIQAFVDQFIGFGPEGKKTTGGMP